MKNFLLKDEECYLGMKAPKLITREVRLMNATESETATQEGKRGIRHPSYFNGVKGLDPITPILPSFNP